VTGLARQLAVWGCACALLAGCALLCGCSSVKERIAASHFRDWRPEQAVLPYVEFQGNQAIVRNVRNCKYFSNDVYMVDYYDKTIDLDRVEGVDFIVVPFKATPALAHVMISFELSQPGGTRDHMAVSVETRKQRDQDYNPVKGAANEYELMYVVADERDVIQYRTNYNNEDVYLYHTVAGPQDARALLVDVLGRVNQIHEHPEFYNTLTNNCTSNIVAHVNTLAPRSIPFSYKTLFPAYSDRLAYELDLIPADQPFDKVQAAHRIDLLAQRDRVGPDFSSLIRAQVAK